jgi:hypothetical protein
VPSVGVRMRQLAPLVLAACLLAGCGASPRPSAGHTSKVGRPSPSGISAAAVACFPGWEQTDLRIAQATKLPVPTTELVGTESAATTVTLQNLPVWIGDAADTEPTAGALLKEFTLRGQDATGPHGALSVQADPLTSGVQLYIEEVGLTQAQQTLLAAAGAPVPGGPVTLVMQVPGELASLTIQGALQTLLTTLSAGHASSATLYSIVQNAPQPSRYEIPDGTLHPAALLSRLTSCTAGPAAYLQETGGLLEPVPVFLAEHQGGVAFGFAPGLFMLESHTASRSQIYWYAEPQISVSAP